MTTANAAQTQPDDGLTPGERAYMNGGDASGLVKEGLTIEAPEAAPPPAPLAEPAPPLAPASPPDPAAAAPQPAAADDDDDQPELDPATGKPKKRGGWISKKAFDAEREERKRIAQELGSTKEQWARLEERFKVFQEAIQAPDQPEPAKEEPIPDPEQDIFGYLKAMAPRIEQRFSDLDQRLGQVHQSTTQQQEHVALVSTYADDARRFAQAQPDFAEAYRYLMANRDAELQAAGYADPQERLRLIVQDEQAIVLRTLQAQGSPAERVYALARARGYAPQAAPAPNGAQPAPAPANGGAAPAASAASARAPSAADEIARVQKGQEASISLSNVGGNRPNNMSIMDLVNMSDADFRDFAHKNPRLLEQMAGK